MKKIIFSLVLMIGMLLPTTAFGATDYSDYREMSTMENVNPHKTFTIQFNKKVELASVTGENFFVVDESGSKVATHSGLSATQKKVLIAPQVPYNLDETYTLVITDQVNSSEGQDLNMGYQMDFTVSNDTNTPFIQ